MSVCLPSGHWCMTKWERERETRQWFFRILCTCTCSFHLSNNILFFTERRVEDHFFLEHLIIDDWYKSDRRYEDNIHVMYVCRTLWLWKRENYKDKPEEPSWNQLIHVISVKLINKETQFMRFNLERQWAAITLICWRRFTQVMRGGSWACWWLAVTNQWWTPPSAGRVAMIMWKSWTTC